MTTQEQRLQQICGSVPPWDPHGAGQVVASCNSSAGTVLLLLGQGRSGAGGRKSGPALAARHRPNSRKSAPQPLCTWVEGEQARGSAVRGAVNPGVQASHRRAWDTMAGVHAVPQAGSGLTRVFRANESLEPGAGRSVGVRWIRTGKGVEWVETLWETLCYGSTCKPGTQGPGQESFCSFRVKWPREAEKRLARCSERQSRAMPSQLAPCAAGTTGISPSGGTGGVTWQPGV